MFAAFQPLYSAAGCWVSEGENASSYHDCHTKKTVLLKALFETKENLYELDRIFIPERVSTSRYIKVKYTFLDSDDVEGNCSVTYIWAIGGFLLVQPPKVFQFTSLLFSTPANNLEYLNLTLPYECRPLVNESMDGENCSCAGDTRRNTVLDRVTQQVYIASSSSSVRGR